MVFFPFSAEALAPASRLPLQLAPAEIADRTAQAAACQQQIAAQRAKRWLNQTVWAFVEGYHPDSRLLLTARHAGQAPGIDSQIIINNPQYVKEFGKRYPIRICATAGLDLVGEVNPEFL